MWWFQLIKNGLFTEPWSRIKMNMDPWSLKFNKLQAILLILSKKFNHEKSVVPHPGHLVNECFCL